MTTGKYNIDKNGVLKEKKITLSLYNDTICKLGLILNI